MVSLSETEDKRIEITMEEVTEFHDHPLTPFTRFVSGRCVACCSPLDNESYIYGGYRCNELGCKAVFHKECVEALPEITHASHPDHPLKLIRNHESMLIICSMCQADWFEIGYCCSICEFYLHLRCAWRTTQLVLPENSHGHEHPLQLSLGDLSSSFVDYHGEEICKVCHSTISDYEFGYRCQQQCGFVLHVGCVYLAAPGGYSHGHEHPLQVSLGDPSEGLEHCEVCSVPISVKEYANRCQQCKFILHVGCFYEAYHTSHPKHKLKSHKCTRDDAAKKCLLCGIGFNRIVTLHHCDVCHFKICERCMHSQPPLAVLSSRTHEHQLHLVPRHIKFTCDACGTQGDQSPYFCLQCNFMIHRECIDLPRVININRHDHRVYYTIRLGLGHGEWKCKFCRQKVDGFYGGYSCYKCSDKKIVFHLRCATRKDVWDQVELEGTPEEEEIPPFQVIGDDNTTIKHVSHDHNLEINKDGMIQPESIRCTACVFQICSEPSFYSCKQCVFFLHEKCANLPLKKRHVCHNLPFTLRTDSLKKMSTCELCREHFSGFRYESGTITLDVRCGTVTDSVVHDSHAHRLYYTTCGFLSSTSCSVCNKRISASFSCDWCEFRLCYWCVVLPQKVMRHRYDDHPLFLSYGESNVDEYYWCEACETKLNPKKWFYTCKHCGVVLHISCGFGILSYVMPGTRSSRIFDRSEKVVDNTSICRKLCCVCNSRCRLPTILSYQWDGYTCSYNCYSYVTEIYRAVSSDSDE
ncbi:hypothetical protein EUTSA_v10022573mg [Eutrema salsugineum]|uniref:FYVE-type domain-containing protein n=1 Tax=Eutrema salsugineum TaxID=72664 RepID=V4LJQ2_EUTSA|nr:uncharacterized protein LOC18026334 [Eutrema salsugineum]ESQ50780.1 hypothetical protein EUTSA_v10022573mg [Eutrema salsugineum]